MQTGGRLSESSSLGRASNFTRSSSSDSPDNSRHDLLPTKGAGAALTSLYSDGSTKLRTIAIGVQAHKTLQNAPFEYAFNHLVEPKNCKVVVICCLSRIQDEMGVDHPIDVETFGGVCKKKVEGAINTQMNNLNHFLRLYREQLIRREVELDIRISAGPKSDDSLVRAATALHPHWVVLDRSFSGHQKKIQKDLECNLVLMKKGTATEVLKLAPRYLGPVQQIPEEDPEAQATPSFDSRTSSSNFGSNSTPVMNLRSLKYETNSTQETTNTKKVFSCISCIFFTGRSGGKDVGGPTEDQTFLYGGTAPGSQGTSLSKVGHYPSVSEDFAILSCRSVSSPEASSGQWFGLAKGSSTKITNNRSVKSLEAELEAQMAMPLDEKDSAPYRLQL